MTAQTRLRTNAEGTGLFKLFACLWLTLRSL